MGNASIPMGVGLELSDFFQLPLGMEQNQWVSFQLPRELFQFPWEMKRCPKENRQKRAILRKRPWQTPKNPAFADYLKASPGK